MVTFFFYIIRVLANVTFKSANIIFHNSWGCRMKRILFPPDIHFLKVFFSSGSPTPRNRQMFSSDNTNPAGITCRIFLCNRIRVSKGSIFKFMPADCTKKYCKFHCANIPISLWKRESCSAEASTLHESYLHCTKRNFPYFFCAICQ